MVLRPPLTPGLEFFDFGAGRPHVMVTAGVHGGEATGIWAARTLAGNLSGREVAGSVTVLPVANPPAFRRLLRTGPDDDVDLNRIFPGEADGSTTHRIAHQIWERAQDADVIVDLHCCGVFGSDYTLAMHEEFEQARDLARKLDIPVVVQSGGTRGQLFVEACHAGRAAVIIELAGGQVAGSRTAGPSGQPPGGMLNRTSGERAVAALTNLLIRLAVLEGAAPPAQPVLLGKLRGLAAHRDGLWTPLVGAGSRVVAGQAIGSVDGAAVEAPSDGYVITLRPECYVFEGSGLGSTAADATAVAG